MLKCPSRVVSMHLDPILEIQRLKVHWFKHKTTHFDIILEVCWLSILTKA